MVGEGGIFLWEFLLKNTKLSKSKFIAGLQCLKRLHLQCYEPELAPPPDDATQAIFDQGHEVGKLAQKAFTGGVLVDEEYRHHKEAMEHTGELLADSNIPAIYEAAFEFENIGIRADILQREPANRWKLIEVKSTTRVKDEHFYDVAIQKHVLEETGIKISTACLMHLNRQYVYDGNTYKLDQLFSVEDITANVTEIEQGLPRYLNQQWQVLELKQRPEISPGAHCANPYTCPFFDVCNEKKPDDWVGNLPGIRANKLIALESLGIYSIKDIPADFPLSPRQRLACDCIKQGKPYFDEGIQSIFSVLKYPLYFMDFETINPAIPRHAGMRAYDQIPFQWSVHIQNKPGSELEHYKFLAEDDSDPRELFVESLLEILERSEGDIIVYNQAFESTRLNDLAGWLPGYKTRIEKISKRLWDLLPVIRDNVYHPDFLGSYSMKSVLPALILEMTYEGMEVADGVSAGVAFEKLIHGDLAENERSRLRKALLAYCRQDTLAMVRLLERLDGFTAV